MKKVVREIPEFYSCHLWGLIIALIFFAGGCRLQERSFTYTSSMDIKVKRLAVLGFERVIPEKKDQASVPSPISSYIYRYGFVPLHAVGSMNEALIELLREKNRYELISMEQVRQVYRDIKERHPDLSVLRVIQMTGSALKADGVLVGYIYRWHEREGGALAASSPASVAFDLYLVKSDDGVVVWKAKFDKTQKSLTENLLDVGTFFRSKGQWVSAKELSLMGLKQMVKYLP